MCRPGFDGFESGLDRINSVLEASTIGGLVLLVVGVLLITFRVRVARWNRRAIRQQFGRLGNDPVRNSSPGNMFFVGVCSIVLGVFLVARQFMS